MRYLNSQPARLASGQPTAGKSSRVVRLFQSLLLCAGLIALNGAQAGTVYETNFESPTFSVGAAAGQDGWQLNGDIQTAVVASGSQAFHLGTHAEGYFQGYKSVNQAIGGGIVSLTVDFMRSGNGLNFTGVSLWADTGFLGQITALTSSEVQLGNDDSNTTPIAFTEGVWHALRLDLDLDAQTLSGFIDGTSLGTLALNPAGGAPSMITGIVFYGWGSVDGQDMYYDNLALFGDLPAPSSVPVPPTFMLLGLILAGLSFKRRMRI